MRIRAGGKRTWVAQYRLGTKQRRITLGTPETVDFDEAKKRARAALGKVALGTDPQSEKREARVQASVTLGVVADRYLATRAAVRLKPRTLLEVTRHLEKHWAPLRGVAVGSVKRSHVASRLAEIAVENGPFAANRARAALSALYGWAVGEGLSETNPVFGTHKPAEEKTRDRVLSDEELALVWQLVPGTDFVSIVRLLILTGQRREEVGGLLWHEVGASLWRIGKERTKNRLPHEVPLSPAALSIIGGLPHREGRDLVFGIGQGGFSGYGKPKAELDARILAALKQRHGTKTKLAPWRLHDIRRTVATRMADLGVLPHVIEAVLNHISGHRAGVAGVYNRAAYAAEKRAALDLWGARVAKLVEASDV
ncbi:site-specific integrase [Hyphomicrobiales bacterium BP6-180914]|uniref:Site-specific integrase n=2 Tax=Lichenifustis flavocetrariae TaxID=2949735 RepID=A0AA41YXZ7_9HYPH|nr:site-specific integrase [Lichenifustis flavocetrariae]